MDTIVCLNVLEHIKDDDQALCNMNDILCKGGRLILLLPNIRFLYGKFDRALDHFRRYNKRSLSHKLKRSGFAVNRSFYINFLGIFGWFFYTNILKGGKFNSGDMKLYDKLFPLFYFSDKLMKPFTGLSIICICSKK